MATKLGSGNPEENGKENGDEMNSKMDFEIIDESEIISVSRGRKANIDKTIVEQMKVCKVNQGGVLKNFSVNVSDSVENQKKEKAKNSAQIRAHAKAAGWKNVSIKWDVKGIPFAKRIG